MASDYRGLVFVEDVLHDLIKSTLEGLQQDTALMARMVQRHTDVDALLNYLTQTEIKVHLGFGRDPYEVPQVSITLASESDDRFIGDELIVRDRDLGPTATLNADITQGKVPPFDMPYTGLTNGPFAASGRVQVGNEFFTYKGDDGSKLSIVGRNALGSGKDFHGIGTTITAKKQERELGFHSLVTYRIDCLADNADVVLWMQNVVKATLLLSQAQLFDKGLLGEFHLTGTDFAPRPALYPEFLYVRTLMLQSRVEVAVPEAFSELLEIADNPTVTGVDGGTTVI